MVLKIDCPDETGLVYRITKVLFEHELNIVRNDEYVDEERQHFFMRTEFYGVCDSLELINELKVKLPEGSNVQIFGQEAKKLLVFVTKEYQCLGDILNRCLFGELNAEILAVISNHNTLEPLVNKYGIPFHFVDHREKSRNQHEVEVMDLMKGYAPDYLVLAKYMRILTPNFVQQYNNQIINIHHSFLPAFKGARPYKQAFDRGVKIIGATAHFVNNELDEGPIILQDIIKINHRYSAKAMSRAGKDVEKIVLARALHLVVDNRIFINKNKTIVF